MSNKSGAPVIEQHLQCLEGNRTIFTQSVDLLENGLRPTAILFTSYPRPRFALAASSERPCNDEDPLFEALKGHSARWKTLRVLLQLDDLDRLCQRLRSRMPLLDTLCIHTVVGGRRHMSGWLEVFKDAHQLQNLSLRTPGWFLFLPRHLPATQLTHLYAVGFIFVYSVLRDASSIQECSVSLHRETEHGLVPSVPLLVPHLRSFTFLHGEHHGLYLNALTMPMLDILELVLTPDDEPHFLALISRSSCVLRTFRIVLGQKMTTDILLRCFAATPSLTELTMDFRSRDVGMLNTWISALLDRDLLPQLTTLRVRCNGLQELDYRGLVEALASRAHTLRLRDFSVEVDGGTVPDFDTIQSLKAFVSSQPWMDVRLSVDGHR
ncbi:hypothetical protein DFH09DRAFT_1273097 [Mycena vulgaris]|nr:hypothetical protein DFH09DRAFT_1273097 [Mycena vulgaris]